MTKVPAVTSVTSVTSGLGLSARAFPGASSGVDVVPGRPERVQQVADQLQQMSDGLLRLAAVLQSMSGLRWSGLAARKMSDLASTDAEPFAAAGALMAQSADHLRQHARVLAAAQARADDAVALDLRAATLVSGGFGSQTAAAVASTTALASAAALRETAVQEVAAARAQVRASAVLAVEGLRLAARLAPDQPSFASRQLELARSGMRDFNAGAAQTAIGLVGLAARFGTARAAVDPSGWADDAWSTVRSSADLPTHPRRAAAALFDVETWRESRMRWAGGQALGFALGAGAGTVAAPSARAATIPARLLATTGGARGAALAMAIRERPAFGRSALRAADVRRWASKPSPLGTVSRLPAVPRAVAAATARDAAWAARRTTPRIQRVADRLGAQRVGAGTVLKGPDSLRRKLGDQMRLAPGRSPAATAARIDDALRYTLVFPDDGYVAGAVRTVQALRAEGFDLAAAKSAWGSPRYQGVNLVLSDPATGRLLEVQVHTPSSWDATKSTHGDYELYRDAGVAPLHKAQLERAIGSTYATVPRPPGIEHLRAALTGLGRDVEAVSGPGRLVPTDPWRTAGYGLFGLAAAGESADARPGRPAQPLLVQR